MNNVLKVIVNTPEGIKKLSFFVTVGCSIKIAIEEITEELKETNPNYEIVDFGYNL